MGPLVWLRFQSPDSQEASAAPGGWAQSLWRLGVGTSKGGIQESRCTVCFAVTHLIVLGKIKQTGSQPCPRLEGSPLTPELLDLKPRSFMSFSISVHTHPSLLLTLLTAPNFSLQNAQNSCLKAFTHTLSSCFTCPGVSLGTTAFRKLSFSFSSSCPPLTAALCPTCPPLAVWWSPACLSSHQTALGRDWDAYIVVVLSAQHHVWHIVDAH